MVHDLEYGFQILPKICMYVWLLKGEGVTFEEMQFFMQVQTCFTLENFNYKLYKISTLALMCEFIYTIQMQHTADILGWYKLSFQLPLAMLCQSLIIGNNCFYKSLTTVHRKWLLSVEVKGTKAINLQSDKWLSISSLTFWC